MNAKVSPHPGRWASHFAGADVVSTAADLELNPGATGPIFDSDLWDLTEIKGRPRADDRSAYLWNFANIKNERWRTIAKDLALALLAPTFPLIAELPLAHRTPFKPTTVASYVSQLTRWLNWMTAQGLTSMAEVDTDICNEYLDEARWARCDANSSPRLRMPKTVAGMIKSLQALSFYNDFFEADRYAPGFMPWDGRSPDVVAGVEPVSENATPPIPLELLDPLLANCLYLVDVIGPRLAPVVESWRADPTPWGVRARRGLTSAQRIAVLEALDMQRQVGEPMAKATSNLVQRRLNEGWDSDDLLLKLNPYPLIRAAGMKRCPPDLLESLRVPLEQAVTELGIEGQYARDAEEVPKADNSGSIAWTEPMSGDQLECWWRYVFGACAVVIAAVSGMRKCELAEIMPGALNATEIPGGGRRYRLSSKRIKGQPLGGVADEWIVIEEVHRAIALASRLALPGDSTLLRSAQINNFAKKQRELAAGPNGQRLGLAPIPDGPITARMLRRTLSIEMSSRPGGLIATKVHFKHVSIVTTEGYQRRPGGAQAVFHREVQREEQRHRLALVKEAYADYQRGINPSGPGARHLLRAFELVDTELRNHRETPASVLTNDRRIENLLRSSAKTLHIGAANYCWFADPSKALCLKLAGTPAATNPLIGLCDSTRCPQATHHHQHRAVWADTASSVTVFLGNPRISRHERERLNNEYARAMRVVHEIDQATQGHEKLDENQ